MNDYYSQIIFHFCVCIVQTLNLSDNFFTDIPSEVCGLVKLRHLVVQRNSLLRLSPDLYKLRYVQHLKLGENVLEGSCQICILLGLGKALTRLSANYEAVVKLLFEESFKSVDTNS